MHKILNKFLIIIGNVIGKVIKIFNPLQKILFILNIYIYTSHYKNTFKHFGKNSKLKPSFRELRGAKYIEIGNNCYFREKIKLTAWESYKDQTFTPVIKFGNNCIIGAYCHITAINEITFGNNVGLGDFITISDNSHGSNSYEDIGELISNRPLSTGGKVIIEDSVWIGERSCILPGVKIGRGSIIGAGSVIRTNMPPYSIVIGNPAKVVGFVGTPQEIFDKEVEIYPEKDRLSLEVLEKNYHKYYTSKIKVIRDFLKN